MCGQRITALRLMAGLGRREAARLSGLPLKTYMALEADLLPVDDLHREVLAALFDVPPESLCSGPLPVPRSFGTPITAEDDLVELVILRKLVDEKIDRYRQGLGREWEKLRRDLESYTAGPLIVPFPRLKMIIPQTGVHIWLDLPHEFALETRGTNEATLEARFGGRVLSGRKLVVGPGQVFMRCIGGSYPASIRPVLS